MTDDKKPKPMNIDQMNLELMKLRVTDMPSILEYAHNVGGFSIVPTNQGMIKSHARDAMKEQTEEQLSLIFEQMKTLARQVQDIKKRVYVSDLIYNASLSFTPVIGKIYYLYQNDQDEKRFLSLVSPKEWGEKMRGFKFVAEVKLNADHTWKVINSDIQID